VVASILPHPAFLGAEMTGKTCAGTWVTGLGKDGKPREVYVYHVVDTEETWANDHTQAVTWQTAIDPVVTLELMANGIWSGSNEPSSHPDTCLWGIPTSG
jgi:saccharopine dehydrogenase (NAD+, L-lysine-forming)